jgi:flagellar basal body-associated protein FliL
MNVQEINGTGHMLWVFIVTTVVLLAVAGLLFTIVAVVTNHRRKLIARRETREREGFWGAERSFKEKILLVPLYTK